MKLKICKVPEHKTIESENISTTLPSLENFQFSTNSCTLHKIENFLDSEKKDISENL